VRWQRPTSTSRQFDSAASGPWGPGARIIVGALLLGSVVQGQLASWALGLLGFPAMLLAWQWPRARRSSARLEVTGPPGHARNLAVPNWPLRRDDQIGGAVFRPIEHLERRGFPETVRQPSVRVAGGRLTADRSGAR
jgi:hypothetical protein